MTTKQIALLNALITFAAENVPGGLTSDEREVARIVGRWVLDGAPVCPVCPHCGSVAPYGDERIQWIDAHINSVCHRWWWNIKNKF